MNILDIFYKCIVPEATSGRIDCLTYYNIAFSTIIMEEGIEYSCTLENEDLVIPTLMIKDREKFDNLLIKYVDLALKFYDDNNFDEEILNYQKFDKEKMICKEKVILTLLFANATIEDFNNPIEFLNKQINFLSNDYTGEYNFRYCDSLKGNLFLSIEKDIINNETPYQMVFKCISNDGDNFIFPKIKFGISDDTVYIYAIQNKKNEDNSFCKKINRVLYRVGEGFQLDTNELDENLKDITASFLVSLNMGISFLFNNGFNKIVVPSILVERWNAKCISNKLKIEKKKLNDSDIRDLEDKHDIL